MIQSTASFIYALEEGTRMIKLQYAGGILPQPVQKLVATLIFAHLTEGQKCKRVLLRCPVRALPTVRLRCTQTAATCSGRFFCRWQRSLRAPFRCTNCPMAVRERIAARLRPDWRSFRCACHADIFLQVTHGSL